MNTIKFRVYDTLNKEYVDAGDIHIDLNDGDLYKVVGVPIDSSLSAGLVSIHNQKRYIIEQSIGLKDEYEIEIYEGDKVLWDEEVFEIVYDKCDAMFCIVGQGISYNFGDTNSLWLEVVGNIHEDK